MLLVVVVALCYLVQHEQLVSGIDWAPKSNKIVTCSHDRNSYVHKAIEIDVLIWSTYISTGYCIGFVGALFIYTIHSVPVLI